MTTLYKQNMSRVFILAFSGSAKKLASFEVQLEPVDMRLSNEESSDHPGPSRSAEMRQKNTATVNPFIARPVTYYGDGPFDPPSSDDEEDAEGNRHSSETNAESVLLLNVDKSGPSTPGRAERGDQSPHRIHDNEKVRGFLENLFSF